MNGKTGEWLRYLGGLAVAGIVAYFTSISAIKESIGATNTRVSVVETREQARYEEMVRFMGRLERFMERIEADGMDRSTGEPYSVQRQFEK